MMLKIGLEIHVPITTLETKLFCSCPNPAKYKTRPNTIVCPICLGLPGALPRPNKRAIILGIRVAKALNCEIANIVQFYRKHYFYPDLPKGYQISQYDRGGAIPLAWNCYMIIRGENNKLKKIRIRRIQLEEDPARIVYPASILESTYALLDFNRSGVPLLEIITEPDFESPKEARIFLEKLQELLRILGVIDEDISANIRCDANVSIKGGERVEIKNIGSFKEVEKALSFEIMRMHKYKERGIAIKRETRHWDQRRKITVTLREKEEEADYRYFPDPNIPPIIITDEILGEALKDFPELPDEIFSILSEYVPEEQALIVAYNRELWDYIKDIPRELWSTAVKIAINELKKALSEGYNVSKELFLELVRRVKDYGENRDVIYDILTGKRGLDELKELERASEDEILSAIKVVLKKHKTIEVDEKKFENFLDLLVGEVLKELRKKGKKASKEEILRNLPVIKRRRKVKKIERKDVIETFSIYDINEIIRRRIPISEISIGDVVIAGWIERIFNVGGILFAIIRDWSGKIQVKVRKERVNEYFIMDNLKPESFVVIEGKAVHDRRAPGGIEIDVNRIYPLSIAEQLPLSMKSLTNGSIETRIKYKYLDLRTRKTRAILLFRSKLVNLIREYLLKKGFVEIDTPKIIATATEGGAELFPLLYYGKEAFLAQSPQLYKQMAINAFEKVFEIAHYFRAQQFDTPRHLSEFYSLDVEIALASLDDLLELIEDMMNYVSKRLREDKDLNAKLSDVGLKIHFPPRKFERITYQKALEICEEKGVKVSWGDDLSTEALKAIAEEIGIPFFITHWPTQTRAFYYKPLERKPEITASFDWIWPRDEKAPLELASGGERIANPNVLIKSVKSRGMYPESYDWYIEMFRYGVPPHAGFGIGIDRLVMALLNLETILETVISPRSPKYHKP